jgi:Predicted peptidase
MKNKVTGLILTLILVMLMTGCSKNSGSDNTDNKNSGMDYSIVMEGFDWGAAASKIVLNVNEEINSATLHTSDFAVTGTKKYVAVDYATKAATDTKLDLKPVVDDVYTSDDQGNKSDTGKYITIVLSVKPEDVQSTLFYSDAEAFKHLAEFDYDVKLVTNGIVKYTNGTDFKINKLNNKGYLYPQLNDFKMDQKFTNGDITLPYASYEPKTAVKGKTPLIIWLHGGGEGGLDTKVLMLGEKTTALAGEKIQNYFGDTGAYVLAPQCPTCWMDLDGKNTNIFYTQDKADGSNYYTESVAKLIDDFIATHENIDPSRVYVGGCSNGGYMTLELLMYYPEKFAAAFPVCEGYAKRWFTEDKLNALSKTPIWFVASKYDGAFAIYEGKLDQKTYEYIPTVDGNGNMTPIDNYSIYAFNTLKSMNANAVFTPLDKIVDQSGKYFVNGSTTQPYMYNGHFSWIPVLNADVSTAIDGKDMNLYEWLNQYSK